MGPRKEPVTSAGDTPTLEEGSRSTGALKIVRVRSPANNRFSSASRQKGPQIRTPLRPLLELFLLSSSRFAFARPALALHAACTLFCYFASSVLLPSLLIWVGPGSSRVTFYLLVGTSLRTNTFRGRTFPFLRVCGLLPLPLLGHGTCVPQLLLQHSTALRKCAVRS